MATKKPAKKSSSPAGAVFMDFERDGLDYDIDALARRAVLKHPAVQKRIEKMKTRLSKTANGHGGITAMRAEEPVPKMDNGAGTGSKANGSGKLKGPAQAVSTRMPRQDKLPKPKRAKASKTSY